MNIDRIQCFCAVSHVIASSSSSCPTIFNLTWSHLHFGYTANTFSSAFIPWNSRAKIYFKEDRFFFVQNIWVNNANTRTNAKNSWFLILFHPQRIRMKDEPCNRDNAFIKSLNVLCLCGCGIRWWFLQSAFANSSTIADPLCGTCQFRLHCIWLTQSIIYLCSNKHDLFTYPLV